MAAKLGLARCVLHPFPHGRKEAKVKNVTWQFLTAVNMKTIYIEQFMNGVVVLLEQFQMLRM
jgi:hypothetical protein